MLVYSLPKHTAYISVNVALRLMGESYRRIYLIIIRGVNVVTFMHSVCTLANIL